MNTVKWMVDSNRHSKLVIGSLISSGNYREVYSLLGNDNYVLKVNRTGEQHNFMEVKIYQASIGTPLRDRLAKVIDYSYDYEVILMERTKPVVGDVGLSITGLIDNQSPENFGTVVREGKEVIVTHDYADVSFFFHAVPLLLQKGSTSDKWDGVLSGLTSTDILSGNYDLSIDRDVLKLDLMKYFGTDIEGFLRDGYVITNDVLWIFDKVTDTLTKHTNGTIESVKPMRPVLLSILGLHFL